jgi:hypothetical protein
MVLVLGLVLAPVVTAQERPAESQPAPAKSGGSWLPRWLPFGGKAEEPGKTERKQSEVRAEEAALVRKNELAALYRRQAVCVKLKEIAARTSNAELERQADELDALAFEIYMQRTAHLPRETAGEPADPRAPANGSRSTAIRGNN